MAEAHETEHPSVSPRQIAIACDRVISAHWRGETDAATAFGTWFEAHWSEQAPPEPDDPPEGTSILGGAGSGIRWYARDEAVLGYVSRRPNGCYRVQVSETVPSFMVSGGTATARQVDADHLLHTVGASPFPARSTRDEREPAVAGQRVQGEPTRQRRPRRVAPDDQARRVLAEPAATGGPAGDGQEHVSQDPGRAEVLVAVHVLESTVTGDPTGVPAGP